MKIKSVAKYNPSEIEPKWQKVWVEKGIYQPDLKNAKPFGQAQGKRPFYNLMMFPYPSAEGLHVGNMYAFTGADIYGRFKRMQGYDVFEPIGLDGFGIHSENYAIKIGKHPAVQAKISEKNFYRQLHAIGNGFAWKNHLETYDPDYYKWTQWIFVQMFKAGLAYRKKSAVNFCPSCKTVLADEQVIEGACERCKTLVEKKELEQWFFRITKYAEKLLQNTFKESFKWSEKVKIGQRNWIGKSEGAMLRFKVKDLDLYFEMFDSVPQTYMAQTFTVIAPEHPDVYSLVKGTKYENPVMDFVEKVKKKKAAKKFDIEKETEGVFTGRYVEYPPAKRFLPIWVASFVIAEYGTGVVNSSAHDERDFIFAKKYDLPLHPVMFPKDKKEAEKVRRLEYCYHHEPEGILAEPQEFAGRKWGDVREDILDYIEKHGWGKRSAQYHLRDWLISRQRYWGAPIPMIYCESCAKKNIGWQSLNSANSDVSGIKYQVLSIKKEKNKNINIPNTKYLIHNTDSMPGWYPVPEDQLPVLLPEDVKDWKPEGTGKGPLAKLPDFVKVACPECGETARRETDVCDTFLDSSWYHMRYPSVKRHSGERSDSRIPGGSWTNQDDKNLPWDPQITRRWLPVTQYIGGAEHTVLHLLYARFVAMVFKDLGMIDFEEPYTRFYAHGLIIAEGAKMSKSRGNIVNPDEYIRKYGADTLRTYLMFLGPFDAGGDFRDTGIAGMYRFLGRVWRLVNNVILSEAKNPHQDSENLWDPSSANQRTQDDKLTRFMHHTIKEVTEDLGNLRYNTAIAHIMEYVNALTDNRQLITDNYIKSLLLMLAPFAPHMTEELWQALRHLGGSRQARSARHDSPDGGEIGKDFSSIHLHPWPSYDPQYLIEDEATIVVQVNGKTRDVIKIPSSQLDLLDKSNQSKEVEKIALSSAKVQKHLSGKSVKKTIFVPGRLINFVV
jgi:leucyl-tRNA synthetase